MNWLKTQCSGLSRKQPLAWRNSVRASSRDWVVLRMHLLHTSGAKLLQFDCKTIIVDCSFDFQALREHLLRKGVNQIPQYASAAIFHWLLEVSRGPKYIDFAQDAFGTDDT